MGLKSGSSGYHTFRTYVTLDVYKLWDLTAKSRVRVVPIGAVRCLISRPKSPSSGFSPLRLANADCSYPLILGPGFVLIDGRHRWLRLKQDRCKTARVVIATRAQLALCMVCLE